MGSDVRSMLTTRKFPQPSGLVLAALAALSRAADVTEGCAQSASPSSPGSECPAGAAPLHLLHGAQVPPPLLSPRKLPGSPFRGSPFRGLLLSSLLAASYLHVSLVHSASGAPQADSSGVRCDGGTSPGARSAG
ncbi:hypothetical protein Anapl_03211 [Anas platyrhynchos]|uniref:Uncharacterized protein n=1 Tax=Anas platyrhynchos TaxID=8839 RepID=R0JKQ9_ANAPL|nr:hypothetical protein Anapl_03211 [Anas platyrhynchos]